jgi:hypothetical protein
LCHYVAAEIRRQCRIAAAVAPEAARPGDPPCCPTHAPGHIAAPRHSQSPQLQWQSASGLMSRGRLYLVESFWHRPSCGEQD